MMANKLDKPIVKQYSDSEWEFIYPSSIDNEKVNDLFWDTVNLLDDDDIAAEKRFKRLIEKHPFFLDAYNHLSLAFRNQKKGFESLITAEKSFNLGTSFFPPSFDFKKDKLIWPCLENRPFLRACQIYGLECQYHKKYDEAIYVYQLNLSLNEDDHQGIRYLLLESFFAKKDYQGAKELITKYTDDYSIEFKFGIVTLAILEGDLKEADKMLPDAIKTNDFFIAEVIKEKHTDPSPLDAGVAIGSVKQAFHYWERNESLYKNKQVIRYFKERWLEVNSFLLD